MKRILFTIFLFAGLSAIPLESSSAEPKNHAGGPVTFTKRHRTVEPQSLVLRFNRDVSGSLPRAVEDGNALELLNPFAPAKYDTAEQKTAFNPDTPDRGAGTKLISVSF